MGEVFTLTRKKSIATAGLILVLACSVVPTYAQIAYMSAADIKAQTRKSKREAVRYEADYKESHLDISAYNFKRGLAGRKTVMVADEPINYDFDKEINVIYPEPQVTNSKKKFLRKTKKSKK